eukprot:3330288-Pyramimonas_sp.AAC.1
MQGLADAFSEGFRVKRLTVSDKTVVLASSLELGKRVVRIFRARGMPAKYAPTGVDLGVDTAAGRFRT